MGLQKIDLIISFLIILTLGVVFYSAFSFEGIRIDKTTGCHYLSNYNGGITPRLDANGVHICDEVGK